VRARARACVYARVWMCVSNCAHPMKSAHNLCALNTLHSLVEDGINPSNRMRMIPVAVSMVADPGLDQAVCYYVHE